MATKAGWYPDPKNRALIRYWDGAAWIGEARPPEPPSRQGRDIAAIKILLGLAVFAAGLMLMFYAR